MKKIIGDILTGASYVFILWALVSWVDVCCHNLSGGTNWKYNLFVILFS